MTRSRRLYILGATLAVLAVLFLLLGIGALGIIGSGDRDAIYLAVPAVAVVGAAVVRFRAGGMALAMAAAALTTLVVAVVAVVLVLVTDESASILDIVGISGMYAAMFAFSAWLFRGAATSPSRVGTA